MKKIVIFVHGDISPEFKFKKSLHNDYEKKTRENLVWKLVNGHLNINDTNFTNFLRELKNANVFLCDSDNTKLNGEIENKNFQSICHENLLEALEVIKAGNPQLKIFIKDFPYISKKERENLRKFGIIIDKWLDDMIIKELKK